MIELILFPTSFNLKIKGNWFRFYDILSKSYYQLSFFRDPSSFQFERDIEK